MGFPSPAADYVESRISLDQLFIDRPSSTYFFKAGSSCPQVGITEGAVLVIDSSLSPVHGSIIVSSARNELSLMRYLTSPVPALQSLSNPKDITPVDELCSYDSSDRPVWGVVTSWHTRTADITTAELFSGVDFFLQP